MKRKVLVVLVLCVSVCVSASTALALEKITTAGSSTVFPIVLDASSAFKKSHPDVSFTVGGGGSSHGVKSVATNEVNIGQASRYLKNKEMEKYPNLKPYLIGQDGIAIIVNADNPVGSITKKQVQDIYTGKITNWKELGGNDQYIRLISKEEGRSTLELFLKYFSLEAKEVGEGKGVVMVHKAEEDAAFTTVEAILIGPNKDAIANVITKPNAIAYVSIGTAQEIARRGAKIKLLTLDGVEAKIENIANETYPLRRPLHIVTSGDPQGTVKKFVDFLLSDAGQDIVRKHEFIAVN